MFVEASDACGRASTHEAREGLLEQPPLDKRGDLRATDDEVVKHAHIDEAKRSFQAMSQVLIRL